MSLLSLKVFIPSEEQASVDTVWELQTQGKQELLSCSSWLLMLQPKGDCGPTKRRNKQQKSSRQASRTTSLPSLLGRCLEWKAACAKRYLLRLAQWENWAQAFPSQCFPSAFDPGNRFGAKWTNTWQAWTQGFSHDTSLYTAETQDVEITKPWVPMVLNWLTFLKS